MGIEIKTFSSPKTWAASVAEVKDFLDTYGKDYISKTELETKYDSETPIGQYINIYLNPKSGDEYKAMRLGIGRENSSNNTYSMTSYFKDSDYNSNVRWGSQSGYSSDVASSEINYKFGAITDNAILLWATNVHLFIFTKDNNGEPVIFVSSFSGNHTTFVVESSLSQARLLWRGYDGHVLNSVEDTYYFGTSAYVNYPYTSMVPVLYEKGYLPNVFKAVQTTLPVPESFPRVVSIKGTEYVWTGSFLIK